MGLTFKVFHSYEMETFRKWRMHAKKESMEMAGIWLTLMLRADQTVEPSLLPPLWYPITHLGYSNHILQASFDFLRHQALREPTGEVAPFQLLDCYVKATQITEYLAARVLQTSSQG